ncbi:hypothetical protein DF048_14520 [Burkholderia seminalis]|nr:hypothetical protein DF032_17140 [Burkholderia seminalis]RQS94159.1 hypothetical protein DF048_14520 [Burkholderia seminalis]
MGCARRRAVSRSLRIDSVTRLLQYDVAHCYHSRHAAPVPGAAPDLPQPFAVPVRARRRPGPACQ